MTSLLKYTKDFKVSKPIFRLNVSDYNILTDGGQPIDKYKPTPIPGDKLSALVCSKYREQWSRETECFTFNAIDIAQRAMDHIRIDTSTFIENSLEMKNPKQSKLYKWIRWSNSSSSTEVNEILIMVYKYLLSFCLDGKMKTYDNKHKDNAIALLQAIMEKYER